MSFLRTCLFSLVVLAATGSAGHAQEAAPRAFSACAACHSVTPGQNRVGPSLHGVYGRPAGQVEGFNYSPALRDADIVWNDENLHEFLKNPRQFLPGNRMFYAGMANEEQREAIIEYLRSVSDED